jgi:hypothetical protein
VSTCPTQKSRGGAWRTPGLRTVIDLKVLKGTKFSTRVPTTWWYLNFWPLLKTIAILVRKGLPTEFRSKFVKAALSQYFGRNAVIFSTVLL